VGDVFGGMFAQLYGRVSPGAYFLLQAVIAALAALGFGRIAKTATFDAREHAAPDAAAPHRDAA